MTVIVTGRVGILVLVRARVWVRVLSDSGLARELRTTWRGGGGGESGTGIGGRSTENGTEMSSISEISSPLLAMSLLEDCTLVQGNGQCSVD